MFQHLSAILLCLSSLSFSQASNTTKLIEHSLTLREFDALSFTDILTEYGGEDISSEESQELFDLALAHGFATAAANPEDFYTFIACVTGSAMSVSIAERKKMLVNAAKEAGIETDDILIGSSYGAATQARSCWVMRVHGNSFEALFSKEDDNGNFIEITPLIPAMKIAQNTVDTAILRLSGNELSEINEMATENDELGLRLGMCPGVFSLKGEEFTDAEVKAKLLNSIMDGETVKTSSWQYGYVSGGPDLTSTRMVQWHTAVDNVVVQGGADNNCYNAFEDHLVFVPDGLLDSFAITFDSINATEVGFDSDAEFNFCVGYLIHAVALQQDVCSVETAFIPLNPIMPPTSSGMSMMLTGKIGELATLLFLGVTAAFSLM